MGLAEIEGRARLSALLGILKHAEQNGMKRPPIEWTARDWFLWSVIFVLLVGMVVSSVTVSILIATT